MLKICKTTEPHRMPISSGNERWGALQHLSCDKLGNLALPNLLGETGIGGGFRRELGQEVVGWPELEAPWGHDCLAFWRCFPFFWDRCLFPVWLWGNITGHFHTSKNWGVEQVQGKREIRVQVPSSSSLFFSCIFYHSAESSFLKGLLTLSFLYPPPHQCLLQQKTWR